MSIRDLHFHIESSSIEKLSHNRCTDSQLFFHVGSTIGNSTKTEGSMAENEEDWEQQSECDNENWWENGDEEVGDEDDSS